MDHNDYLFMWPRPKEENILGCMQKKYKYGMIFRLPVVHPTERLDS